MRSLPTAPRVSATLATALLLVVGCTEPDEPGGPDAPATDAPEQTEGAAESLTADIVDPTRDELLVAIETLTTTIEAARQQLDEAADATGAASARRNATAARELLLDDPEDLTGADAALFPARTVDRSDAGGQNDLLTTTLALAREAGGTLGRATVEALREPVAGDLGAWEREAEEVVAAAADAVDGARDADAVADAVLALPGDGVRALAWTLLASETSDGELARDAAGRASGHLAVVSVSLGLLLEDGETPAGGGTAADPADADAAGDLDAAADADAAGDLDAAAAATTEGTP